MRADTCTKVVLIVIAIALVAIAGKQCVNPETSVQATEQLGNLQFAALGSGPPIFDSSNGLFISSI